MEGDALVGKLFAGRFQIESVIGRGGMGVVFKATHEVLQRRFAIKVLRKTLLSNANVAARFRREARAASRIEHPHITYVFDFGHSEEGRPYIAMEYEDGPTLAAVLAERGPLGTRRAVSILAQCADALAAAHAQEVIHRDLKPKNIMLITHREQPDYAKILDFGLAKIMDIALEQKITADGQGLGTPKYMPPEQFLGDPMDHRGDIYSLGAVAFEVLAGRPPFLADNLANMAVQHVHSVPDRVAEASSRTDIPEALDALVARCLAKDPLARYQSAKELHKDLDDLHRTLRCPPLKRRKTANLYALPLPPSKLASAPSMAAASGDATDDDSHSSGDEPLTRSEWPGQEQPGQEQPGLDRRPRALEELAFAARDLGIGSPEISHVLSRKLQAEDLVIELEADVAVIEATMFELEATARERESRLRQALNQLEHEQEVLQVAPDEMERLDTQPWDTAAFSEACEQKSKLEERAREIAETIQQISHQLEQELQTLQAQAETKQHTLQTLQREATRYEEQLAALLAQIKPAVLALDDPELARLLELAGL